MILYSQNDYFLLRKPRGIASSFGEEECILDFFNTQGELQSFVYSELDNKILSTYVDSSPYVLEEDWESFKKNQITQFSRKQEYGLLNRLDNATGGFLYFAKTPQAYTNYKAIQKQGGIKKTYLAFVEGNPFFKDDKKSIDIYFPIMHLASNPEKMIVVKGYQDENKGRGKRHKGKTTIELIEYIPQAQRSLVKIYIYKGIRHQIRVHLASIGAPILGDVLYNHKTKKSDLFLWSIGFDFVNYK